MHKAASTFVADVLFPSIARRSAAYDLFNVGSLLIEYVKQQQQENGLVRARNELDRSRQRESFFQHQPLPKSNCLVGRLYPEYIETIELALGQQNCVSNHVMVMRRDPRDALISLYYSLSISHDLDLIEIDNSASLRARQTLLQQGVCDGVKTLLNMPEMSQTIEQFIDCTNLIQSHDRVVDLPYEWLINDPHAWLTRFVSGAELTDIVDAQWMDQMASHLRPPEQEDPHAHKRRMRPGNWVDVFDGELKEIFSERLGNRLEEFGYCW